MKPICVRIFSVAMLLIPARTVVRGVDLDERLLPYRYAWVGPRDVLVYEAAGDPSQMAPCASWRRAP